MCASVLKPVISNARKRELRRGCRRYFPWIMCKSADAQKRRDELASELRHIAEEIRPLTDSVDSLYLLLQHVWQNREELFELLNGFSERAAIHCERCPSSPSLAEAITDGWKYLRNDDGKFWGICPPCDEAAEGERELLPAETLFCTCCDAVSFTSLAEALRAGWQCIVDDEGNERGNYAGMCPGCIAEEEGVSDLPNQQQIEDASPEQATETQKRLF